MTVLRRFVIGATLFLGIIMWLNRNSHLSQLRGDDRVRAINRGGVALERKLPVGSSKKEVEALLGPPDNTDTQTVWLWTTTTRANTWRQLWRGGGFFTVFIDGKLICPILKAAAGEPEEVLHATLGYSAEANAKIDQLLDSTGSREGSTR